MSELLTVNFYEKNIWNCHLIFSSRHRYLVQLNRNGENYSQVPLRNFSISHYFA